MKKYLFFITVLAIFGLSANAQQCMSGGCTSFVNQFPTGTLTPSTSWQTQTAMNAGNWTLFSVTCGDYYDWTYCETYGGVSTGWDAQLTLFNNTNLSSPLCFSNDQCGNNANAPYIRWQATFTGTVRLLTTVYISGTGCLSNTGLPRNTLAYRKYQSCTTTVSPTFNSNTSAAGFSGAFCANTYTNPCSYYTQVPLTDNWITVNAFSHCGGSSTYNNQINYVVGANPNCTSRVGHIYLYDACNSTLQGTYTVTQSGSTSPVAPTSIYNETSGSPMCQQNTTVNLGANGINPATVGGQWVWYEGSCGGTQVGTGPDIYVSLSQAGTKTYYLRSESSCGNSVCLSTTVTVTAAPPAPTPTLQGSTPCEGSSFVLLAGVTGTYYEWTNPGGSVISNQQNPTITGGAAGQYCLNYDQNGCTSSNGCVNVSFSPLPSIANISGPSNPTEATSQTYNANASNATSYTWAVPSGWLITGGGTSSSINVTVGNSSGQVCATPHNTCDGPQGCKAVTVIPIGISENSVESNIKIYPNPANEFFNIKGDDIENDNYEISITNILGEQLNKAIINVDKHTIEYVLDIKEYASGIYYLNIKSKKINFTYKVEKL